MIMPSSKIVCRSYYCCCSIKYLTCQWNRSYTRLDVTPLLKLLLLFIKDDDACTAKSSLALSGNDLTNFNISFSCFVPILFNNNDVLFSLLDLGDDDDFLEADEEDVEERDDNNDLLLVEMEDSDKDNSELEAAVVIVSESDTRNFF